MRLDEYLKQTVAEAPDALALVVGSTNLTYAELWSRVMQWAATLSEAGAHPGSAVVIRTDRVPDVVAAEFACWSMGLSVTPLDSRQPPDEILHAIDESRADILLAPQSLLRWLDRHTKRPLTLLADTAGATSRNIQPCLADRGASPALLAYTSGSTGPSKCVAISHDAARKVAECVIASAGYTPEDIMATTISLELPIMTTTLLIPAIMQGAVVHMVNTTSPSGVIRYLQDHSVSVLLSVPYIYDRLLECALASTLPELGALRQCISAGVSLPPALVLRFHATSGKLIRSIYGSAEVLTAAFNDSLNVETCAHSVGRAVDGVEIKIRDENERDLSWGQEGEVVVFGDHLASGYLHHPDLNASVFHRDHVHTGDLGLLDQDGFLYLRGRRSESINHGGFLVNPIEVENVMLEYPSVREALVWGEPHPSMHEVVIAAVVPREDIELSDLLRYCRERLASYKLPERIEFVDRFEKIGQGKIRRPAAAGSRPQTP